MGAKNKEGKELRYIHVIRYGARSDGMSHMYLCVMMHEELAKLQDAESS